MKLTPKTLQELINQVYEEAFKDTQSDFPEELPAEPTEADEDPPEDLTEAKNKLSVLIDHLSSLDQESRIKIFNRFKFYSTEQLLQHLAAVKRAEKGDF
jgi:hypothetical protein